MDAELTKSIADLAIPFALLAVAKFAPSWVEKLTGAKLKTKATKATKGGRTKAKAAAKGIAHDQSGGEAGVCFLCNQDRPS